MSVVQVLNAFPPEDLSKVSEIKDSGNLLLIDSLLIVFRYKGITAYDVSCLLYTSDAADDLLCVDLGGRRIIKNKKKKKKKMKNKMKIQKQQTHQHLHHPHIQQ